MNVLLRFGAVPRLAVIVTVLFLLLTCVAYPKHIPTGTEVDILRFDAIIELGAPLAGTHIMLCMRYWVGSKHYSVAVVWAEPYISSLNFPTQPATLNIHSNDKDISLSNQVRAGNNESFSKPLGLRGVFRHKFNIYSLSDIRFAETEALSSRIYTSDLAKSELQNNDEWQAIDLPGSNIEQGIDRQVAKLNLRVTDDRVDALKLVDTNGQLVKSIEYEYSKNKGRNLLHRQNVVLPERTMMFGFDGNGVTLKIGNKEHTYKELPGLHHRDGRKCTVEYDPVKLGEELLALPSRIIVRHAETNALLRKVQMSNYVRFKLSAEEAEQAAEQFGRFDVKELKVRELFSKYWQKEPDKIEDADAKTLKQLRKHFENANVSGITVGEQLKRINILMELDWIQRDDALQKHFKQYLAILTTNDLDEMALVGGLHVIDSTVGWSRFIEADRLLAEWIETVIANCNADEILGFGQNQMRKRHYWTIASLLGECSKTRHNWGQKRFDALVLRCASLYDLSEIIKDPSKAKTSRFIAQAGWASWSAGTNSLFTDMNESLAEAKRIFEDLEEPTRTQKGLRRQLDKIDEKMKQAKKL